MHGLDLDAFRAMPLTRKPFEYLIVPGFVQAAARSVIHDTYPQIENPGSFPVRRLSYGPAFGGLIEALQGQEVRSVVANKFGINLDGRPTMITVRGRCGPRDGKIHTDATNKIITVLIYMNPAWEETGGCLRLLRSATDLDDVLTEVPPVEGTLVAFRRSDNSYHGHKPFIGPRRVIQLNWMTTKNSVRYETFRHDLSCWVKRLSSFVQTPLSPFRRAA